MKKISILLIALLTNTFSLAANSNDAMLSSTSGINLMAPHQDGSWSFGLQANYFEPNNDFNYAYGTLSSTNMVNVTTHQATTYAVESSHDWGWGADITYHFPGESRDVILAFTQLNTSNSDSLNNEDNLEKFSAFGSFFDVVDAIQNSTLGTSFDTVTFSDTTTQRTNLFIQGPYARIQLDVA